MFIKDEWDKEENFDYHQEVIQVLTPQDYEHRDLHLY
jgi:hypothetical protein